MTEWALLLLGILLGVLLTVALVEWHDGHQRRQRRQRTRAADTELRGVAE